MLTEPAIDGSHKTQVASPNVIAQARQSHFHGLVKSPSIKPSNNFVSMLPIISKIHHKNEWLRDVGC